MTKDEQKSVKRSLGLLGEVGAIAWSQRVAEWAKGQFGADKDIDGANRGICVEYQVAGDEQWYRLKLIELTRWSWEPRDNANSRKHDIQNLFYWKNLETSNELGDVVSVRYMPYIYVNKELKFKEDEMKVFPCTDTGEKRRWNHLAIDIYSEPEWTKYDYHIMRDDIVLGNDLNWYKPWHFALEQDAVCPVAGIFVERIGESDLVLRYHDQLLTLSVEQGKRNMVTLENDTPVTPTHTWDSRYTRPKFTFTLTATLSWKEHDYGSSDIVSFQKRPEGRVATSDLPPEVRTMQQIDHDAWEEGVRSGAIGRR